MGRRGERKKRNRPDGLLDDVRASDALGLSAKKAAESCCLGLQEMACRVSMKMCLKVDL